MLMLAFLHMSMQAVMQEITVDGAFSSQLVAAVTGDSDTIL